MKLLIYPNKLLREQTKRVAIYDTGLRTIAKHMAEIMLKSKGIGLAAPQVGILRKIMLVWDGNPKNKILVMCNPEILSEEGEQIGEEGCLSFPGEYFEVKRALKVSCRYQDLQGKLQKIEAEGLLARCILHELDHLNGILFIDKIEKNENNNSAE